MLKLTVNEEIRNVIPTIEAELQNFPLPQLSGQDYRLYKFVANFIKGCSTDIYITDGITSCFKFYTMITNYMCLNVFGHEVNKESLKSQSHICFAPSEWISRYRALNYIIKYKRH